MASGVIPMQLEQHVLWNRCDGCTAAGALDLGVIAGSQLENWIMAVLPEAKRLLIYTLVIHLLLNLGARKMVVNTTLCSPPQ